VISLVVTCGTASARDGRGISGAVRHDFGELELHQVTDSSWYGTLKTVPVQPKPLQTSHILDRLGDCTRHQVIVEVDVVWAKRRNQPR
jgi:hypothetical protein